MVFTRTAGPVNLRHINLWWTWTQARPGLWVIDQWTRRSSGGPCRLRGCRDTPTGLVAACRARPRGSPLDQMIFTWGDHGRAPTTSCQLWHGDFPWRHTVMAQRRRSDRSRRTRTASTTWRATSGTGRPTGTPTPPAEVDKPSAIPRPAGRHQQQLHPAAAIPGAPQVIMAARTSGRQLLHGYRPLRRPQMIDTGMSHIASAASRNEKRSRMEAISPELQPPQRPHGRSGSRARCPPNRERQRP